MYLDKNINDIFISVIISLLLLSFILYSYLIIIGFKYFGPKSRNYLDFCKSFSLLSLSYLIILQFRIIYIVSNMKYSLNISYSSSESNLIDDIEINKIDNYLNVTLIICLSFCLTIPITILSVRIPFNKYNVYEESESENISFP
jgi:hypothetical protein